MSEEVNDLKLKLELMENNISEIRLYLEEAKQPKSHKISQKVFDLHKETTHCAKEVSEQLKHFSFGDDFNEMRTHRILLVDFLTTLSDLSSIQRQIIDNSVANSDCVDCGRNSIVERDNRIETNRTKLWLTVGIAVIGGITLFRALKN